MRKRIAIQALCQRLGYHFKDQSLIREAMSHASVEGTTNNERLEFLGDGVLNLVIAAHILELFPRASEGQLSRIRAQLVCKDALAEVGQSLRLQDSIILGPSEARGGSSQRRSIVADAVEATIGAVFLDSDYQETQRLILLWFTPLLADLSLDLAAKDAKTKLQEFCQRYKHALPVYELLQEHQSNGETAFHVEVIVDALSLRAEGQGSSRKKAEQIAAQTILSKIKAKK